MAFAASSRKWFSRSCGNGPSRFFKESYKPVLTPLLFSKCNKKTGKLMETGKCMFTVKELLYLNSGDFSFIAKEIRSDLNLTGFGVLLVDEGSVVSRVSKKRCCSDDVQEISPERKRKKTLQTTNPLSRDYVVGSECKNYFLASSKNLSRVHEVGSESKPKQTSDTKNLLPPSKSLCIISEPKLSLVSSPLDSNLGAATIKTRFADTILKAQEQLINNGDNKAQKEKIERRKANMAAELKYVETMLKEKRQKEREAARVALERMERSIEWNDATEMEQEFQRLIGA